MKNKINADEWKAFLNEYSLANQGRPTRLGIFEHQDGVVNDLWIEDGLPLIGIELGKKGEFQSIEIMLENFTHIVETPRELFEVKDDASEEEGLDVVGTDKKVTILRFENFG